MRRVLLAVSGGKDSMTMADKCIRHSRFDTVPELSDCEFAVVHCNFHLRGEESDGDAAFVEKWARGAGVPFYKADFDTVAFASEHNLSIEMAARELRYKWFAEVCTAYDYDAVAVAHNANDNAETLILNLLRGTGLKGVSGMSYVDILPYSDGGIILLRPLLDMSRREIEAYVSSAGLGYRTDRTNLESEYKRNFIRNEIFPLFEHLNPSFVSTLNRDMTNFSRISGFVKDWVEEKSEDVLDAHGNIDVSSLILQKNWEILLFEILSQKGFNPSVCSDIERLLKSSGGTFSGKTFACGGLRAVTSSDKIIFAELSDNEDESVIIDGVGEYDFAGRRFKVEIVKYSSDMPLKCPEGVIMMDAKALPLACRHWKEGDWFVPLGMKGKKKLSDFFTDRHFSLPEKERAVILCHHPEDSRVAALLGYRIDDSVKVTSSTEYVVRIIG